MTDDELVRRLRERVALTDKPWATTPTMCAEAADAIERLTQERNDMMAVSDSYAEENQRLFDRAEAAERTVEKLREALKVCAIDLEAEVRNRYMNGGDVHPALRWRYERDMAPVVDARAALDETEERK